MSISALAITASLAVNILGMMLVIGGVIVSGLFLPGVVLIGVSMAGYAAAGVLRLRDARR